MPISALMIVCAMAALSLGLLYGLKVQRAKALQACRCPADSRRHDARRCEARRLG